MNYKKKYIYLLISAAIFAILIYAIAIKQTLQVRKSMKAGTTRLEQVEDAPRQIKILENRLSELTSCLGDRDNQAQVHEGIHEFVGKYCQNKRITFYDFPPIHLYQRSGYLLETNRVIVEGRFLVLLQLLNELEKRKEFGKIISIKFYTEEQVMTKSRKLYLEMYLQNIKKQNNV